MFNELVEKTIELIKKNLPRGLVKEISYGPLENPTPPYIEVYIDKVKIVDIGAGTTPELRKEEKKITFNGTGTKKLFTIGEGILRPISRVEHPPGFILTENKDFKVDYKKGTIEFKDPPKKGKENIVVIYTPREKAKEIYRLRVRGILIINVSTTDPKNTDKLAEETLKIMSTNQITLETEVLNISLSTIKPNIKQIKIIFETEIIAEKKAPIMEEIIISTK